MQEKPSEPKLKRKLKSASELLGDGKFYPDAPRVAFSELLNIPLILIDTKIIQGFKGQFGEHDAGLMLFERVDYDETYASAPEDMKPARNFTTICSGQVVVERLGKLYRMKMLPCLVTPVLVNDSYYNLL